MDNAVGDPLAEYRSGSTEPWTADVIAAIVRARRPNFLIETGTYEGRTTRKIFEALNHGQHSARFITIEHDPIRAELAQAVVATWETNCEVGIGVICGDALEYLKGVADNCADIIFLDDDHTPEHVGREVYEAMRILRPGGILLMHDVVGFYGLGGIVRALGGAVLDLPRLHAAGGLGIVTK